MAKLKQFASIIVNSAAFENFVALLENTGSERPNFLRVLTYHRVDKPNTHPWMDPGLISASPEVFEAQMKYLTSNYQPVSAADVVNAYVTGGQNTLPSRAVLVTFDDAYCDFEQHAWPVLKQYRLPAILFVPTGFPDHPERSFWWDSIFDAVHRTSIREVNTPIGNLPLSTMVERDQAYRSLKNYLKSLPHEAATAIVEQTCTGLGVQPHSNRVLSWVSLRVLSNEGLTLGAHTRNHPIMSHSTADQLQDEVSGSVADLRDRIGITPQTFAYPSGMHNDDAVNAVESAGLKLAFTTGRGINHIGHTPRLRLQRINVGSRTTLPVLRAQLLSWSIPIYSVSNKFFG